MTDTQIESDTETSAGPGYPQRWSVLAIVLVAELMDLIDGTIVNVAAPSIRADLGGSATTLQWLGAAYTLAFAVLLITGGRLGDRFGRRQMFLIGIVGFTASSVLCAVAPSSGALIAFRVVQGGFGALLIPQGFGMIKQVFPDEELTKAFAMFGPVIGLAAVISPIIGGALVDADLFGTGWRAIFLVNVPLGLLGLVGALRVMPRSQPDRDARLDPIGFVLLTLASLALIYPLVQGRELGWPLWCFALLALAAGGLVAFMRYERRHRDRALITPSLLQNRAYTSGLLVALCFFAALIGLNLVLSVFCQLGQGFSPLRTGLTLAPFAFGVALSAPAAYPLAAKLGRRSLQLGFIVMAAGLVVLALMVNGAGQDVSSWTLVPGELVAGVGMGFALPPLFDFILSGVTGEEVGSASGVLNAIQQLGAALGIAVLATIFFAFVDDGRTAPEAMTRTTLLTLVPLGLALLASTRLPRYARELGAAH